MVPNTIRLSHHGTLFMGPSGAPHETRPVERLTADCEIPIRTKFLELIQQTCNTRQKRRWGARGEPSSLHIS